MSELLSAQPVTHACCPIFRGVVVRAAAVLRQRMTVQITAIVLAVMAADVPQLHGISVLDASDTVHKSQDFVAKCHVLGVRGLRCDSVLASFRVEYAYEDGHLVGVLRQAVWAQVCPELSTFFELDDMGRGLPDRVGPCSPGDWRCHDCTMAGVSVKKKLRVPSSLRKAPVVPGY